MSLRAASRPGAPPGSASGAGRQSTAPPLVLPGAAAESPSRPFASYASPTSHPPQQSVLQPPAPFVFTLRARVRSQSHRTWHPPTVSSTPGGCPTHPLRSWVDEEDTLLRDVVRGLYPHLPPPGSASTAEVDWQRVAAGVPGRTAYQCLARWRRGNVENKRKGKWRGRGCSPAPLLPLPRPSSASVSALPLSLSCAALPEGPKRSEEKREAPRVAAASAGRRPKTTCCGGRWRPTGRKRGSAWRRTWRAPGRPLGHRIDRTLRACTFSSWRSDRPPPLNSASSRRTGARTCSAGSAGATSWTLPWTRESGPPRRMPSCSTGWRSTRPPTARRARAAPAALLVRRRGLACEACGV